LKNRTNLASISHGVDFPAGLLRCHFDHRCAFHVCILFSHGPVPWPHWMRNPGRTPRCGLQCEEVATPSVLSNLSSPFPHTLSCSLVSCFRVLHPVNNVQLAGLPFEPVVYGLGCFLASFIVFLNVALLWSYFCPRATILTLNLPPAFPAAFGYFSTFN